MLKKKVFRDVLPSWKEYLDNDALDDILTQLEDTSFTPPAENIFEFAKYVDPNKLRVVIIGQDPYPKAGDAHGLAFSCQTGVPASLKNIYKCLLAHKLIKEIPTTGNLEYWARQGVLLINTALTTVVRSPNAHLDLWLDYTTELVANVSKIKPLIFMLWGNHAIKLEDSLGPQSICYKWAHPSPLAQMRLKFVDCPHFTDANKALKRLGADPIDWNVEPPGDEIDDAFGMTSKTQVVFTDGSCEPNNASVKSRGGYAAVFAKGSMADVILYGNIETTPVYPTNQRAEGIAILKVFEYLHARMDEWQNVIIVSDSQFWIDMFERYMPSWVAEDKFDEKKNPDLTKALWNMYSGLTDEYLKTIQFRHMKSHGKDGWDKKPEGSYEHFCFTNNQYVDELAGYARTELKVGEHIVGNVSYEE